MEGVLTPTAAIILSRPWSTLRDWVSDVNPAMLQWLTSTLPSSFGPSRKPATLMLDFLTAQNTQRIVQLNRGA